MSAATAGEGVKLEEQVLITETGYEIYVALSRRIPRLAA